LKIPSFDKLRMVSEVEPPKAGERGIGREVKKDLRRKPFIIKSNDGLVVSEVEP